MAITLYEQETIINFNKEEKTAYIYTYEKTWQKHLEKKLGLTPVKIHPKGAREYKIDKQRISMPRAPRKMNLTPEQRKRIGERFTRSRIRLNFIATATNQDMELPGAINPSSEKKGGK